MKLLLMGKSGAGKTTVEPLLSEKIGFDRIISTTTRPIREGEVDGVSYYFVTVPEFKKLDETNQLVESIIFRGNHYGIQHQHLSPNCVIVVEPEGIVAIKNAHKDAVSIRLRVSDDVRFDRLDKDGRNNRCDNDEDRFDDCICDYEVNANNSIKNVLCELLSIYNKVKE